jgi:hypothetical protein
MKTDCLLLCLAVSLSLLAGRVCAQIPPTPPAPHPVSLAAALAAMPDTSVADGSIVLTVQPDQFLPVPADPAEDAADMMPMPDTVPTPETLAARYGRSFQIFSHVIALAPPTMTVLASNPAIADLPLSTLAVQHPMPFLLGTLTQAQLQQMGTVGLGFSDLSPDQQALLKAALPSPFQIVPKSLKQPGYTMDEINKTGEERAEIDARIADETKEYKLNTQTIPPEKLLSSLRLYGFLAPEFGFNAPGGSSIGEGYSENGFETTGSDKLANGGRTNLGLPGDNTLESILREEEPNTPKASDLEWNQSALAKSVSLAGIKTVDDLTARLAKATGLELYADPHYGPLLLLARGDLKTPQPAADVMQALALCVCGTWRQVGPAYVLTDDVQGLGTRQEFLREMVQAWSNRLTEAGKAVGGHLGDLDWLHTLNFAPGDIGALSEAQVDSIHKKYGTNDGNLHWKDLPAPLQAGLRGQLTQHFDGDNNMNSFEAAANSIAKSLTPGYTVEVTLNLRLGVALPDTGIMTLGNPYPVQMPEPPPSPSAAVAAPPKAQANSIVLDKPLRGVLCAPRTAEEARAVVAMLPKMGLNTLFLDVFTNGRAYFPNTALPPTAKAGDVLQAALDAAQTAHIAVYAVMDLLCWRKDGAAVHPQPWPVAIPQDLTITGEAPDRSVQRQLDANTIPSDFDREYEMVGNGNQGWVSPLDPRVSSFLPSLVHDLAENKSLSGLVFQDTAPPGYLALTNPFDEANIALGYTLENRLAYLRAYHSDPVDLSSIGNISLSLPFEGFQISFDVSLAPWGRFGGVASTIWNEVRGDADKSLLASCYAAARSAAPTLPLFMRERQLGATFDPWVDPKKLNQIASPASLDHPFHQITPASILSMSYGPIERAHPDRLVWQLPGAGMVGDDGKRAGGEVFDVVTGGPPEHLLDTLDKLNVFLKKP